MNLVHPYVWLNLASARGAAKAMQAREKLLSQLSSAQLADAQQESRTLDQKIPRYSSDVGRKEHHPRVIRRRQSTVILWQDTVDP
ncbi:hypothetical protein [Congregibacter sp.]|uniref:hypothetical protein n=1 Tax=Congregibacter sp. TaxID=2744308 RepID=UPI003F6D5D26